MDRFEHRKSTTRITLRDAAGLPVAGQKVRLSLKTHEFLFGTGTFFLVRRQAPNITPEKAEYYEKVWQLWQELFNYATLPFYLGQYEPVKGQPNEAQLLTAAKELTAIGRSIKGHPLCWHTATAPWLMDMDNAGVLEYQKYRIHRELAAFRQDIHFWDVINEVVIMPEFDKYDNAITRLCNELGRVGIVKAMFDAARDADPNATLLINDFNTSDRYRQLIRDCLDAGVCIDTIGIQSHQHQGFWGMDKLVEVVDRYEQFGLPIHFTENTFVSGHLMPPEIVDLNDYQIPEWPSTPEGEDRQANDVLTMLDYLFSRPLVQAFTTWDFEDAQWLGAPSGLIRKDGSKKPAFEALDQRINHDWHTEVEVMTDENGTCELTGFRGEYTLSALGRSASLKLAKDTPELTVTL